MLARLFIVLLLAFSLSSARGWTPPELPAAIEVLVIDAESGEIEATVTRAHDVASQRMAESARVLPVPEGGTMSADLGRVFRPPRSLGS